MSISLEPAGILAPGGQFTLAELCAMRQDGVLAHVYGQAFRSIAEPETPALRAAALAVQVPAGLAERAVLGRSAAAWIYGCAPPPPVICLLIPREHRTSTLPPHSGCVLHEVRLDKYDVDRLGGAQVTCALRTAVDVATNETVDVAVPVLLALAGTAGLNCPLGRISAAISLVRHVPGKRRAQALVRSLLER
ncbi:hypothetical protein CVV68_10085 [Arthrobacter livingstonensis]|uniref:AbiEi antitoxin C-terminal domain-containing protein n=1 Tax=Arthrobacter livingstonensis TaxID=670078 RepID=A0A2V5L9L3_9MICC|nr:hypothetical protein [Arthrobacter livingstonensis]PYI67442.1 hypothetical protein CVV68_10085 [Arthrobacter livingstonensis]